MLLTHKLRAELVEAFRWKRLGEHVGDVVVGRHMRHGELVLLDHIANIEVPTENVLGLLVMLGIVGEIASTHVIRSDVRRAVNELVREAAVTEPISLVSFI